MDGRGGRASVGGRQPGHARRGGLRRRFAMTVPPPVVTADRVQLATLVAADWCGQIAQAIAANEAAYGECWGAGRRGDVQCAGISVEAAMADRVQSRAGGSQTRPERQHRVHRAARQPPPELPAKPCSLASLMSFLSSALQSLRDARGGEHSQLPKRSGGPCWAPPRRGLSLSWGMSRCTDQLPALVPGCLIVAASPLYRLCPACSAWRRRCRGWGPPRTAGSRRRRRMRWPPRPRRRSTPSAAAFYLGRRRAKRPPSSSSKCPPVSGPA